MHRDLPVREREGFPTGECWTEVLTQRGVDLNDPLQDLCARAHARHGCSRSGCC